MVFTPFIFTDGTINRTKKKGLSFLAFLGFSSSVSLPPETDGAFQFRQLYVCLMWEQVGL